FTQKYGQEPNKIYLCVDNDDAGKNFVNKFTEHELISKKTGEKINFIPKFPEGENCKDWNDVLIEKKYMKKSEIKESNKDKYNRNKKKEVAGMEL
ncbi:toprim domain-containing protein, partial [Staphylococcus pseudintermedius]|nr:toprim domain-containing protein [Staphylococcus pseudintermedius]